MVSENPFRAPIVVNLHVCTGFVSSNQNMTDGSEQNACFRSFKACCKRKANCGKYKKNDDLTL